MPWMVWKRAMPPKISRKEVHRRICDMPPDLTSTSWASIGGSCKYIEISKSLTLAEQDILQPIYVDHPPAA